MTKIRRATKKDIPKLIELYNQLFSEMVKLQPLFWQNAKQDFTFLEKMITGNNSDILVAENSNVILGLSVFEEKETPPYAVIVQYKYVYITDLVVAKNVRGTGVGTLLLEHSEKWAKKRNLSFVDFNVLAENTGALNLYKRVGYKENMHLMRKMI